MRRGCRRSFVGPRRTRLRRVPEKNAGPDVPGEHVRRLGNTVTGPAPHREYSWHDGVLGYPGECLPLASVTLKVLVKVHPVCRPFGGQTGRNRAEKHGKSPRRPAGPPRRALQSPSRRPFAMTKEVLLAPSREHSPRCERPDDQSIPQGSGALRPRRKCYRARAPLYRFAEPSERPRRNCYERPAGGLLSRAPAAVKGCRGIRASGFM